MAPKIWMPGAERWNTGSAYFAPMGQHGGGTRRVTWHTTEGPPGSMYGALSWLDNLRGNPYYSLLIDPKLRRMAQCCGADRAARSMRNGGVLPGGQNQYGLVNIQISVVGYAADKPMLALPDDMRREILKWTDSWGVPRTMPSGDLGVNNRNEFDWRHFSGHFSHAQALGESRRVDPGPCTEADLFKEDTDMPNTGTLASGPIVVPPGGTTYVKWPSKWTSKAMKPLHSGSGVNIGIKGPYTATLELLKSEGALHIHFNEVLRRDRKAIKRRHRHEALTRMALVTNSGDIRGSRLLRIALHNPTDAPIRVRRSRLRLLWW